MRSLLSQLLAVGPELAAFILTSPLLSSKGAYAITPIQAPSPNLDLSSLGQVAVAGDFDSISLYSYYGQTENVFNTNGSQSILTRYPNGAFDTLATADASVESMCTFKRDGKVEGVVLAGNFTGLDGIKAQSIALWDPDSGKFTPISGINGLVSATYCDDDSGTLYIGGMFTAGNSTNAMAYTSQWNDLPFAGFNGEVTSITKNSAGNIVFGGSFTGLGSMDNGNNSAPIKENAQVVNLSGGKIGATGTTSTKGFDDPKNIICKTGEDGPGNTWLLADNTGGWWEGQFGFGFNPTKLRLYNTKYQGRGTKSFRFENLDNGGVLNLNYIDSNGHNRSCSDPCPLPADNTTYQDFFFVPSIGMAQFRIFITEWYGDGGGLSGIEMFQDDLYSFAVSDFNEPKCDDVSQGSSSTATPSNLWKQKSGNQTSSDYLSAYLTTQPQLDSHPSVVFKPDIRQNGNYSILLYTPGCIQDDSCETRGAVNLTGSMTSSLPPVSTTVTQTNQYDKFDQIYYGYVDVDSGAFQPSVTLAPIGGQLPQTIVAQRVRFDIVVSTSGLNGLYEYIPNKATVKSDFPSSAIDTAGTDLDSGAIISQLVNYNDHVYVAGRFKGDGIQNCMRVGSNATSLPGGGLNADVHKLFLDGSTLYIGGNFTNTIDNSEEGLNNVAAFDIDNDKWITLGGGVDGTVWFIVPMMLNVTDGHEENCITINGDFSSVNAHGGKDAFDADGFAIWVPSKKDWINNIPKANVAITGKLMAEAPVPGMQYPLYAGQITSQGLPVTGVAEMFGSGTPFLTPMGVDINPSMTSSSSKLKRAIDTSQISGGVYTGLYYDENDKNVTILGGHFSASVDGGDTVHGLVFDYNFKSKKGFTGASELDADSTVAVLATYNNLLFAGGSISGTVDGNQLAGIVVYDLNKLTIASPQPPALAGGAVIVNAIATQPDTSYVYVGGDFKDAGSLPCATLCYYDASAQQWNTPGLGLSGTISAMMWSSNTELIIAGDLTVHGKKTTMATYDSKKHKQTFSVAFDASKLPGGITALTPADGTYNQWWAAGTASNNNSAYLSFYDGDKWTGVGGFATGTSIRGLQILSLTSDHGSTDLMPSNEVLLITGNINVPNFGNASAVLYNGTDFAPFLLTNKDDGTQGTLASIFVSNPQGLLKMGGGSLAVGFVVLIGLAIALALIFLIVVAGIFIERARRRREGYVPMSLDKNGNMQRIPPETLLGELNGEKNSPPKV